MPKHDPILPNRRPPDYERAADAWARYKQTMKWMAVVAVVCVLLALIYLKSFGEPVPLHMMIATIAGVGLMVMVGTGLMGLIFLSSRSGHDEDATYHSNTISESPDLRSGSKSLNGEWNDDDERS